MATTDTRSDEQSTDPVELDDQYDARRTAGQNEQVTASGALRAGSPADGADSGWLWKLVTGVGVCLLLGAVGVVVAAGTLGTSDLTNETIRSLRSFALLLGVFVGISGLYVAYHRDTGLEDDGTPGSIELPATRPERAHGQPTVAVGTELDEQLADLDRIVHESNTEAYEVYTLERSLRGLAVRVVASTSGWTVERAREHVDDGTWTDDVRAAAFVADEDGPTRPPSVRLRDWAHGTPIERQVKATVDELAALMEVDRP